MILEDPWTGMLLVVALFAGIVGLQRLWATKPVTPGQRILENLRDVDDDELEALGAKLSHLPAQAWRAPTDMQMTSALKEWRATFDVAARQRFVDLANALVADSVPVHSRRAASARGQSE